MTIGGAGRDLYLAGFAGRVLRSADSGQTWMPVGTWAQDPGVAPGGGIVFTPDYTFHLIAASGDDDVWLGGTYRIFDGALVHSTDRGSSWQSVQLGTSSAIGGVWSASSGHLFVTTNSGQILKTEDGGARWTQVFADSWLTLAHIWGSTGGDLYAVGGHCPPSAIGAPAFSTCEAVVRDAEERSPPGVVPLTGVLLRSSDGGASWQAIGMDAPCLLRSVSGSPDGANVYAAGDCGTVVSTTDRGATWSTSGWDQSGRDLGIEAVWVSPTGTSYFLPTGRDFPSDPLAPAPVVCRSIEVTLHTVSTGGCENLPHDNGWSSPMDLWGTGDDDIWIVSGHLLWHRI